MHTTNESCVCTPSHTGIRMDGTEGPRRSYTFFSSGYPELGTYGVTPTTGNFDSTRYSLNCQDFDDDDPPLMFDALYIDADTGAGFTSRIVPLQRFCALT